MTLTLDFSDPVVWVVVLATVVPPMLGAFAIGAMWATMPPRRGGR